MSSFNTHTIVSHYGWQNRDMPSGIWVERLLKVTLSDVPVTGLGAANAINYNGDTIASVGGLDLANQTVCIFVSSGNTWVLQQILDVPFDPFYIMEDPALIVYKIELSDDGNTLVVGGNGGAQAYIYKRTGTVWGLPFRIILGNLPPLGYRVGLNAVDISNDGNTVAINYATQVFAPGQNIEQKCEVYIRSGASWALQTTLVLSVLAPASVYYLNISSYRAIRLSQDGNILATAIDGDASTSIQVYTRSAGVWTLQQSILVADTQYQLIEFEMNADGNVIFFSKHQDRPKEWGPLVIYTRTGSVWSLKQNLYVKPNPAVEMGLPAGEEGPGMLTTNYSGNTFISTSYNDIDNVINNNIFVASFYIFKYNGTEWVVREYFNPAWDNERRVGHASRISGDGNFMVECYIPNSSYDGIVISSLNGQ